MLDRLFFYIKTRKCSTELNYFEYHVRYFETSGLLDLCSCQRIWGEHLAALQTALGNRLDWQHAFLIESGWCGVNKNWQPNIPNPLLRKIHFTPIADFQWKFPDWAIARRGVVALWHWCPSAGNIPIGWLFLASHLRSICKKIQYRGWRGKHWLWNSW